MTDSNPPVHLRLRHTLDQATERLALRAALTAAHLLGLATGTHLRHLRGHRDAAVDLQARLEEAELRARLGSEIAEILVARFSKIPERNRPHYSSSQRFRILEIRSFLGWNARDTARAFLVCPNTIGNWETSADPDAKTAGSTVSPIPPVRRAADVVRSTAQAMDRLGFGGKKLISRILARAGWKVSSRSVGRYRKGPAHPNPTPEDPAPRRPTRPVFTRFVHHTWMMDITQIRQFLGPTLYLAAVFEAHSRVPLILRVFQAMPGAQDMAALLRQAAKAFRRPKYLLTDLGGEFTGEVFLETAKRLSIRHRFAAAESIKATARLERWWRTLKELARLNGLQLALTVEDVTQRLELALLHYLCFRPHEGLNGATPLEVFLNAEPAHLSAVVPPRGRPGEGPTEPPFRVAFLDPRVRSFPILTSAA